MYTGMMRKREVNRPLERLIRGWEGNIKVYLK
jgi:hypothetical protein